MIIELWNPHSLGAQLESAGIDPILLLVAHTQDTDSTMHLGGNLLKKII